MGLKKQLNKLWKATGRGLLDMALGLLALAVLVLGWPILLVVAGAAGLGPKSREWAWQRQHDVQRFLWVWFVVLLAFLLGDLCAFPGGAHVAGRPYYLVSRAAGLGASLALAVYVLSRIWLQGRRRSRRGTVTTFLIPIAIAVFSYLVVFSSDFQGGLKVLGIVLRSTIHAVRYAGFAYSGLLGLLMSMLLALLLIWPGRRTESQVPRRLVQPRMLAAILFLGLLLAHILVENLPIWRIPTTRAASRMPADIEAIETADTQQLTELAEHTGLRSWLDSAVHGAVALGDPPLFAQCAGIAASQGHADTFRTVLALSPRLPWGRDRARLQALKDLIQAAVAMDRQDATMGGLRSIVRLQGTITDPENRMAALVTCAEAGLELQDYALAESCCKTILPGAAQFPWGARKANVVVLEQLLRCVAALRRVRADRLDLRQCVEELKKTSEARDRVAVVAVAAKVAQAEGIDDLTWECLREALSASHQHRWAESPAHLEAMGCLLEAAIGFEDQKLVARNLADVFGRLKESVRIEDRLAGMAVLAKFCHLAGQQDLRDQCLEDAFEKANNFEQQSDRDHALDPVFEVAQEAPADRDAGESYLTAVANATAKLWMPEDRVQALIRCIRVALVREEEKLARALLGRARDIVAETRYEPLREGLLDELNALAKTLGE